MKKTILVVLLVVFLIGCAQVEEKKEIEKAVPEEKAPEEKPLVEPEVTKPKAEPEPETTVTEPEVEEEPEVQQLDNTVTQISLEVGETKTVILGGKEYRIKLLSVSNRAQFSVNGEFTKDLMLNGVDVLRDGTEIGVVELGFNSAFIKISLETEKEVPTSEVAGPDASGPLTLKTGVFRTREYTTAGNVEIVRTAEGEIILKFSAFQTEPGPGLYVYLIDQSVDDGFEVAKLFSREGNQQYELPGDLDLRKYRKVVIYSKSQEKTYGEALIS